MSQFRATLHIERFEPGDGRPFSDSSETITSIHVNADDLFGAVQQIAEHANTLVARHKPPAAIPERKTFGYLAGQLGADS